MRKIMVFDNNKLIHLCDDVSGVRKTAIGMVKKSTTAFICLPVILTDSEKDDWFIWGEKGLKVVRDNDVPSIYRTLHMLHQN